MTLRRILLTIVLPYIVGSVGGWYFLSDRNCDTDSQCRMTPPCVLTPGCDGGPDPAHQPWRWLP
jgi:hypothetical protein